MTEHAKELNMHNWYVWYSVTTVERVRREISTSQSVLHETAKE